MKPYVYVATGHSRDVQRNAPTGARVAVHYPEIGRTVELETNAYGQWSVSVRPAPGHDGDVREIVRGDIRTRAKCPHDGGHYPDEIVTGLPDEIGPDGGPASMLDQYELGIIRDRHGDATNRWEDGTVGVPADLAELVTEDDSAMCVDHPDDEVEWDHFYVEVLNAPVD